MDDGGLMHINNSDQNMGATSNTNSARLAALQERKKSIEEILNKKEKELRELCLQEADLTGIIPSEMPLQPGESPPSIRRKVGTSYMLPENLLKYTNNKDENIADLELQLQLHANMAEAALGLAHKQNLSKTVRRQHKSEYQHHKKEYKALQEKIALLKEAHIMQQQQQQQMLEQQKQKKKPRPLDQDDGISIKSNDPFRRTEQRQSIRSLRHTLQTDNISELYPQFTQRSPSKNSDYSLTHSRCDDFTSSFYKLNLGGYKSYLERCDNYGPIQYNYQQQHPSYQYNYPPYTLQQQTSPIPQHNSLSQQMQLVKKTSNSPDLTTQTGFQSKYNNNPRYHHSSQHIQSYPKYSTSSNASVSRQSSPNLNTNPIKFQYAPLQIHHQNPHQLQPHQQYEHNAGLGGCWKRKETGEIVWCNNSSDTNWQRDKRFGSLDRRKNRRIQKRISPNTDNKSATLASVPYHSDENKTLLHSPQVQMRHSQDRQLVRTQSLGSVGVQTVDNIWPSDDNSSCESENRSIHDKSYNTLKRNKQKEWRETSLDSPGSPTLSIISRSQSTIPPVLAPEEKYVPPPCIPSPIITKPPLEIPAESNPSPRIPEANIEIFNNNIPKNCTIVQAGHCKPYHEETKPFEMSDFYKYSTKFKKSPTKNTEELKVMERAKVSQRNLNEQFDNVYHHPVRGGVNSPQDSMNMGIDNSPIQEYSQDMNLWFNSQTSREKENNNATLV